MQALHRLEEFEGDEMWDYEGWDLGDEDIDLEEELEWRKPIIKKKKGKKKKKKKVKK